MLWDLRDRASWVSRDPLLGRRRDSQPVRGTGGNPPGNYQAAGAL